MELSNDGKIKCTKFGDLTSIDCVSLMNEDCENCFLYKISKEKREVFTHTIGEDVK